MSTRKLLLLSSFVIMMSSACSSDIFITHNGNMPSNERISQIRVGQSRAEVHQILGAPSNVVSLDKNTYIKVTDVNADIIIKYLYERYPY